MADVHHHLGQVEDLPRDRGVLVDGRAAVFRCGEEVLAIGSVCPHRGGDLADGHADGCVVTCPRHWWRFDLRTGRRLGGEGIEVPRYEVEIEDGEAFVVLPEPERRRSWREILLEAARSSDDTD
jgi:3-phenylpropionate/trans-cinnamate dioxygenase ferredoxin subunit